MFYKSSLILYLKLQGISLLEIMCTYAHTHTHTHTHTHACTRTQHTHTQKYICCDEFLTYGS